MGFSYLVWNKDKRPVTLVEIQDKMPVAMTGPFAQLCASYFGSDVSIVNYPPLVKNGAVPWSKDLTRELPRNAGPWPRSDGSKSVLDASDGWYKRKLSDIDIVTFHHTLSDSPEATAKHYINKKDKDAAGRPSLPYSVWISQTGEILLCVPLEEGLWHDHTGHENTHLSVGLAGSLHLYHPSDAQLNAAAEFAVWAIRSDKLPLITKMGHIKGHMDFISTQCPGWASEKSGNWKPELYSRIKALL